MTEEQVKHERLGPVLMAMTGGDSHEIAKLAVRFFALAKYMNNDTTRTLAALFDLELAEKHLLPRLLGRRRRRASANPRRDAILFTKWNFAPKGKRRAVVKGTLSEILGREPEQAEVTATMQRMQTLARRHGFETRSGIARKDPP
jgi:hypothetical protein